MDLTTVLLRRLRPRPLVVAAPGATRSRLTVERALREWGWAQAATPAEADLLVVCEPVGPAMAAVVERLWRQVPNPRARADVMGEPDTVAASLRAGHAQLRDAAVQRADAVARRLAPVRLDVEDHDGGARDGGDRLGNHGDHREHDHHGGHEDPGHDQQGQHGHDQHGGHGEHGGHADGDHGHAGAKGGSGHDHAMGHDMGHDMGHGMGVVAGLPMADRAPDRDGLTLDRLHVPLGPVLPDWPSGLVLRTSLQGDVVQKAEVEVLDLAAGGHARSGRAGEVAFWDEPWLRALAGAPVTVGEAARRRAAALLDSLGRLLGVAGWSDAALAARRLRDDLLAGVATADIIGRFERLARRLRRSRTLRWLTGGLGVLAPHDAAANRVGGPALRAGGDWDVTSRWLRWLDEIGAALEDLGGAAAERHLAPDDAIEGPRGPLSPDGDPPSLALLRVLPGLVVGAELGAARLIVASLDPDPDELVGAHAGSVGHG